MKFTPRRIRLAPLALMVNYVTDLIATRPGGPVGDDAIQLRDLTRAVQPNRFLRMIIAVLRTCSDCVSRTRYWSVQPALGWLRSRQMDLRTRSVRSTCCRAEEKDSRPSGKSEILPTKKRLMCLLVKTACNSMTTVCS